MINVDLRVKKGTIPYHQLANKLGVNMNTVYNWFNNAKLDEVRKQRLLNAIEEIEKGE